MVKELLKTQVDFGLFYLGDWKLLEYSKLFVFPGPNSIFKGFIILTINSIICHGLTPFFRQVLLFKSTTSPIRPVLSQQTQQMIKQI